VPPLRARKLNDRWPPRVPSSADTRHRSLDQATSRERKRAEEQALLEEYARTREPRVLEELVERFLPLARRLASQFRGGPESFEDLVQIASVGLVNAITRFDPSRGYSFVAFAQPTILGELRRHFRDRTWTLHVDRGLKERHVRVEAAVTELTRRRRRSPSIKELAERLEWTDEQVLEAIDLGTARHALSIDVGTGDDEDEAHPVIETVGDDDPGYDVVEYGHAIAPVLAELSKRDRTILQLRFTEDMTQSEIAARVGVSQMQVSRLLRAMLERLREQVRG
jgi:RNA polymerase sigma-B factor